MNSNSTAQVRHIAFTLTATAAADHSLSSATTGCGAKHIRRHVGAASATIATTGTNTTASIRTLSRTFATVMIFFDQMISGSKGDQVSVVGGRRYGHGPSASDIRVTQLIGQGLKFVGRKVIVVPQDVIVGWSTGALDAGVTTQVKVKLGGMSDASVDCGSRWYVATLAALFLSVGTKESCMMSLLNGNECDAGLIATLQFHACLPNRHQFAC
ncbi:hypothetical protein BpHYR1_001805 [Brachionus plicatilis]|uniref:Uncharacterized protein n=1 Tax=Brachionus plicatilis TaxID=10195 RepID=A0A3M7S7U9_BRAPC|nr:hypothetical protein BpHYR1_001805 [Brachionus plicatilis]